MAIDERDNGPPPEYYIDVTEGVHIVGSDALNTYLAEGHHPADLREIGHLIRSNEPINFRQNLDSEPPSRQSILTAFRSLRRYLPPPASHEEKFWNRPIIERASRVGWVPSPWKISRGKQFGSLSNLYMALREQNTDRYFHDLSREGALEYLGELASELGHIPTEDELNERAREDPSNPSYHVLQRVIKEGKSKAAFELGFVEIRDGKKASYIQWGLESFIANEMALPRQREMHMLSVASKSPGPNNTFRVFGSLLNFSSEVSALFEASRCELNKSVESGAVPYEIFMHADSTQMIFGRFARWQLVDNALDAPHDLKTCFVRADLPDREFEQVLQKSSGLSPDELRATMDELGLLSRVWRYEYIRSLNIEYGVRRNLDLIRGPLDQQQAAIMENAVRSTAALLNDKGKIILKDPNKQYLIDQGIIPELPVFGDIFVDEEHFRSMVRSRQRYIADSPALIADRELNRARLKRIFGIDDDFARRLGGVGVTGETFENGFKIVRLADSRGGTQPVQPGSPEATAIIEKVQKSISKDNLSGSKRHGSRAISGTRGEQIQRQRRLIDKRQ